MKDTRPAGYAAIWDKWDCENYCTASFPHPSCKATGRPCAVAIEACPHGYPEAGTRCLEPSCPSKPEAEVDR